MVPQHLHLLQNSVVGSILVTIGLYNLLWGKSKEIEECESEIKQNQVAQQDDQCNGVSHVIPITTD